MQADAEKVDQSWKQFAEKMAGELPGASEHIRGLLAWYDSPDGKLELNAWMKREGIDSDAGSKNIVNCGVAITIVGMVVALFGFHGQKTEKQGRAD
jgi:hypothetical protein